jgi:zinc protease
MPNITIQETVLDNGLRVVLCPKDSMPIVTVNVTYRVGSHDEEKRRTGLAHLFEHLMFDNNSTGTSKQFDVLCAKAGGTNNAYTSYDQTVYHVTLPSHQLDLGLWLEAERMRQFQITDQALGTQRSVVLEEIKQQVLDQPYGKWLFATDKAAYDPQCHYSWHVYGDPEHVAATTMDDARSFYERFYRPDNAVLCVAGTFDADQALESIHRIFGSIPRSVEPPTRPTFDETFRRAGHVVIPDAVSVPAIFVSVHMPGQSSDAILAADLANSFLGVGNASLLHTDLVKKRGISAHAASYVDRREHSSLLVMITYAMDPFVTADQMADALESSLKGAVVSPQAL